MTSVCINHCPRCGHKVYSFHDISDPRIQCPKCHSIGTAMRRFWDHAPSPRLVELARQYLGRSPLGDCGDEAESQ